MKTSLTVLSFLLFAALGIAHAQTLTILKRTTSATEGSFLVSAPILASDGKVYGIASSGGLNTNGAIYRMNADGSGYVPLLQFASATSGRGNTSPIIEATNGKLYGACPFGGTNNGGTLWRMDKSGANFEVLVAFLPAVDGDRCCSGLIQASDGKLYGTTYSGTGGTAGGIFRMDPDAGGSSFQQLHAFSMATEGKASVGTVLEGSDGRIYGTTSESAANNYGTIWRIDKDGMNFAYIHTFAMADGYNCQAGLVESNGWLVGVAAYGGAHDEGTIFRLKTDGTGFEVMHDFEDPPALDLPFAALTNGGDGFLYGTTYSGGTGGFGGVFRVAPDGSGFKALVDFVGPNGKSPYASLTRIGRGKFLGATQNNTVTDGGLIYRLAMYPDIPTVAVKGKKKLTTSKPSLTLKGTATNAAKVEIKVGKGKYKRAKGTANWSFKLKLKPGKNTITVIAHGPGGDSTPARLTITRK